MERAARRALPDHLASLGGSVWAIHAEQLDQRQPDRMGQRPHRARIGELPRPGIRLVSFDRHLSKDNVRKDFVSRLVAIRILTRATTCGGPRAALRATPASFEDTGKPRRSRPAGASWAVGYEGAGPGPPGPEAGAIARPIPLGAALAAHQATSPE